MQPELNSSGQSRWSKRLEALLLLCLALHGATILISGGRPGDWVVVAFVLALAGWASLQPAPGRSLEAIRAAGALVVAWSLSAVSGGPGSLFTLWFFPLVVVYSLLLPLRYVTALPVVSTLLYVSLGALPGSPLPWGVVLSQAALIALVGGAALYYRKQTVEPKAPHSAEPDEQARQFQADRLAALDRLARGAAHDLNNLLTVIAGQISLAQGGMDRQYPAHKHLENARAAIEQATTLSRRLQISSARSAWEMKPVALNALIESLLPDWRESAPAGVRLKFEQYAELPLLRGDPAALKIVLQEVISHRVAAYGAHQGVLTVSTFPKLLTDSDAGFGRYTGYTLDAGEYAGLAIEDNAEPMDDETLATLFDPYRDSHSSAHGLGLAMVLGIVRSHLGGIAVDGATHRGNIFTLLFPVFQDDSNVIAPAVAHAAAGASTLRLILLVSADLSLRDSLERALGDPALRVMAAGDNARALALHAEFTRRVELVVVNSDPATKSDMSLIMELLGRNARLPIIVIGRRDADRSPMPDVTYLTPPVAPSELAAAVHAALARDRSHDDPL